MKPQGTVGENPAFEIRAELPFVEAGHRAIAFSGPREEGLQLLANNGVQRGLFRAASFVARAEASGRRPGRGSGPHSVAAPACIARTSGVALSRPAAFKSVGLHSRRAVASNSQRELTRCT